MVRLVVIASFLVSCLGTAPRIRSPARAGLILGGIDADIADYPYMLSVLHKDTHFCGASIISANWAITAAHCSIGFRKKVENLYLRAGPSILEAGGSVHQASKVILHENFTPQYDNDISLIKVSTAFPLGDNVQIVPLASSTPAAGVEVTITGWGVTVLSGANSEQLQVVKVPVVDHAVCKVQYKYILITESMLCAGLPEGGKDSCQNDSGGPAVANGQLVGIASWGYGCGEPNFAGIYTDVASLRSWVTEHSGI